MGKVNAYTVSLVSDSDSGVQSRVAAKGQRGTLGAAKREAVKAAKTAAGEGAEFVRSGVDYGYRGPNGMAWIDIAAC